MAVLILLDLLKTEIYKSPSTFAFAMAERVFFARNLGQLVNKKIAPPTLLALMWTGKANSLNSTA